jgi:hypothetical protein
VNEVKNPVDNAHALLSDQMRQSIVDSLASLGATNFHMGFDAYNNATLNYTSKSGTPEQINASLVDYANALDTLKQRVTAQTPAAPAGGGGGGGYAPRGYAPRSSGYTPPAAPPPPVGGGQAQYDAATQQFDGIQAPPSSVNPYNGNVMTGLPYSRNRPY